MDEKQKKQVELIRSALTEVEFSDLDVALECVHRAARNTLANLSAFDVIQGNSEKMLAANALMQIHQQLKLIRYGFESQS